MAFVAEGQKGGKFLSKNFAEATKNFTEMMFVLAVLDLPFEAGKHKADFDKEKMSLAAGSDLVVFHKEIKPAQPAAQKVPILVSQNFFKYGERYTHVGSEKIDKYVTDEFLVHTVYGCHVVITNPTSSRQKLDVLFQVPMGAIPVLNGRYTRGPQKRIYFFFQKEVHEFSKNNTGCGGNAEGHGSEKKDAD